MSLKKYIKSFLYKKPREFSSYKLALEFCSQKTPNDYEFEILSRYRFEKLNNYFKEGNTLLDSLLIIDCCMQLLYICKGIMATCREY